MMPNSPMSLEGMVAIITGAAGGVGRSAVELFVQLGACVVAEDVEPGLSDLFRGRDEVAALVGDVRDPRIALAAAELALARFKGIHILVNNAAVILSKDIMATSEDEWDTVMAVNVKGVFHHCRAVIPHFLAQGSGSIVNVTSISGVVGLPQQAAYCASKGSVVQMTRQLAIEYADRGIRVNSVAPGAIDTPFLTRHLQAQEDPAAAALAVNAAHPLGRYAAPGEIARAIAFLASPASSFITGTVLTADGGYTAR
jgi:NAD(P)-dependent dehydrogenase (short-subunit alcohol dehydrogenase family)